MYRFINFLVLSRISLPFLLIYFSFLCSKWKKGPIYHRFNLISREIPELKSLSPNLIKRIYHYIFANSLTTQWFATLLKHRPSISEKMTGLYLATATPIADHLVDKEQLNVEEIKRMIFDNSPHQWVSLTRKIFQCTLATHADPNLCKELIFKTLQAQQDSLAQNQKLLSTTALKTVTWSKGGYALLLYRSALKRPISTDEWKAVFQLGGLMQLHNDIFDLHRDIQEGIQTIPTQIQSVQTLIDLFNSEIKKTIELFDKLPLSRYRKRKFYLLLNLAVNTGFICLDQYLKLEQKYNHFNPSSLSRTELVCDMEDPRKVWRTVISTLNLKLL